MRSVPKFSSPPLAFLLSVVFVFLPSCSTTGTSPDKSKVIVEVETIKDQALKEIQSTPTDFFITTSENMEAWERARLFFANYLGLNSLNSAEAIVGNTYVLTNRHLAPKSYFYEIRKQPFGEGFNYSVQCTAKTSKAHASLAKRNAQNVARFIKDGTLELSLLEQ